MKSQIELRQLLSVEEEIVPLSDLLVRVVEEGASIGFLPPLSLDVANDYWNSVIAPDVVLYVAYMNDQMVGSVQLHFSTKQNGNHRVEIAKLMTHPDYRRHGIGRLLMQKAEQKAIELGKTLIVLDTREGDPSNQLYSSLGYIQAGRIPQYARSATGELDATIFYYKLLNSHE